MLSDSTLTLLLLALPLIFIGMSVFTAGYEQWVNYQLQHTGITTEAKLVELIKDVWRGTRNFYLVYEYQTSTDEIHTVRQSISQTHYEQQLDKDSQIVLISYIPTNPSVSRLAGDDSDFALRDGALKRALLLLIIWLVLVIVALNQK